jgi:hypothetical protein
MGVHSNKRHSSDIYGVLNPRTPICGAKGRVFESRRGRLDLGVKTPKKKVHPHIWRYGGECFKTNTA